MDDARVDVSVQNETPNAEEQQLPDTLTAMLKKTTSTIAVETVTTRLASLHVAEPLEEEHYTEQTTKFAQLEGESSSKRFQRSGENPELPEKFEVRQAIADGNCFFDSFRQGLQLQLGIEGTVKQLRQYCKEFAQNNPPDWFIYAIANSHDNNGVVRKETADCYTAAILNGNRWGDSEVEGRILCEKYGVTLHVIEKHSNVDGKEIRTDQIIDSQGSRSVNNINYSDENTIHVVNRGNAHFEPVLSVYKTKHKHLSSVSDYDAKVTPEEELINTVKRNDLEEKKLIKLKRLFETEPKPFIDFQDKHNETALHVAVRKKELKIIEFLVKNKAKIDIKNNRGITPLDIAKRFNRQDILHILETPFEHVLQLSDQNIQQIPAAIRQHEQSRQRSNANTDIQSKQEKRRDPVHGYIYQLKLLMLFLYRGVSHRYSFRLGTEIEEANKFDDLVFEYIKGDKKEYRFLQAKHRTDESKKITADNLLTESDGDYSLVKYFFSFQDSKKEKLFKDGLIKDVTICTNIDFDFENLKSAQITVEEINDEDNILDVKSEKKQPMRYRFNKDITSLLQPKLQDYNLTKLARRLAECVLKNNYIQHNQEHDIFKSYHIALAEEVIDVNTKKIYEEFIKNENLSEDAKKFRKAFFEEIKKQSKEKLTLENINDAISNKETILDNKQVGLSLSKNFGKGKHKNWPNNSISDAEIRDFLKHLVFAVNQPNEEELGRIVKSEIGKEFDFVTTENVYNKFFITMLNWLQGKERGRFFSYEEGEEFFEEGRRGISIWFDVRDPVELFTGRKKELNDLHSKIQRNSKKITVISQMTSISGLGGIGKTELARQYIYKHTKDYDNNVIWINAENEGTLIESFHRLAKDKLRINTEDADGEEKDIKSIVEEVYKFFNKRKSLFVFDNAEKYRTQEKGDEGIDKFLPSVPSNANKPYVLITSRNQKWGNIEVTLLDTFTEEEAAEFIRESLGIKDGSQENEIKNLAKTLQRFPLALQQAVAYIKESDIALKFVGDEFKITDYLRKYEEETRKLLDFKFPDDSSNLYTQTTFTTWKITTDKIKENSEYGKQAGGVLDIIAYFAPDGIPVKIFLGSELISGDNKEKLGHAVQLLKQYSMVNSGQEQTQLSIHRLVQQVTRINLTEQNKEKEVLITALKLFKDNVDSSNVDHAISVWGYASKHGELVKEFNYMPGLVITQLNSSVRYEEAHLFGENVLKLQKEILGPNHLDTSVTMANVANVLFSQGKYDDALKYFQEVKKVQGGKILVDNDVGLILHKQGKYDDALKAFRWVFDKSQEISNLNLALASKNNIALVLIDKEEYDEALKILNEVLNIRKKILPPNDPLIFNTMNSTAGVLEFQDKREEAFKMYAEVYEKRKEILGPRHPHTLTTWDNMAKIMYKQSKYDEALKIFHEVLNERQKILPDHPYTFKTMYFIAFILKAKRRYEESLKIFNDVFDKREKVLGSNHSETLATMNNIADVLKEQGKYDEALNMYYKANERRRKYSPDDPNTLITQEHIADIMYKQGKYDQALEICDAILNERKMLMPNHLFTFNTMYFIAIILKAKGRYEESLKILNEVFDKRKIVLGFDHSDTLITMESIAEVLKEQGKYGEALQKYSEAYERRNNSPDEPHTITTQEHISEMMCKLGLYDNALKNCYEVLDKRVKILNPDHPDISRTKRNIDVLRQAIDNGSNTKIETIDLKLHFAAQNGQLSDVNALLNKGAVVDAQTDDKGVTPLHLAAFEGHVDVVITLLNNGADVNFKDNMSWTPLHYAAQSGQLEVVNTLLNEGADMNARTSDWDVIPLYLATQNSKEEVIQTLQSTQCLFTTMENNNLSESSKVNKLKDCIEKGAIIGATNNNGFTALHLAVHHNYEEIVRFLLEKGADFTSVTTKGNTPLHIATLKGIEKVAEMLLEYVKQSNPNKLDSFVNAKTTAKGTASLHVAVQKNNKNIVEILLQNGAHYDVKNAHGTTPLDQAKPGSDVRNLLGCIDQLFQAVRDNKKDVVISLLKGKDFDTLKTILYARNCDNKILVEIANTIKQRNIAELLSEKLKSFVQSFDQQQETILNQGGELSVKEGKT